MYVQSFRQTYVILVPNCTQVLWLNTPLGCSSIALHQARFNFLYSFSFIHEYTYE